MYLNIVPQEMKSELLKKSSYYIIFDLISLYPIKNDVISIYTVKND